MLTATKMTVIDAQNEIDRLQPLAEAERLAAIAGIENHWKGAKAKLESARVALQAAIDSDKAAIFASQVREYNAALENVAAQRERLDAVDQKIDGFSPDVIDFFKRANDIAKWTDRAAGRFPQYRLSTDRYDALGRPLDASPIDPQDAHGRHIVPDEHWSAVTQLRELHVERVAIGHACDAAERACRDIALRNPALRSIGT